jgi:DNA polymerase
MEADARPWLPEKLSMKGLRAAAADCRGCELWEGATQVVFSAGPVGASLMLVGEQPGDREDRESQPFVGPAGRILDQALEDAGTRRDAVYLTNAVKHFRFEQRGKRRIHQKPDLSHMVACAPWLQAELGVVEPAVVVALGATAGRAVLGRAVKIGAERGRLIEEGSLRVLITSHPSAVVRMRGRDGFDEAYRELVDDLAVAVQAAS